MDRRKLGSKNSVLHKQFRSSSQLGITRVVSSISSFSQAKDNVPLRSSSVFESLSVRKRKNSDDQSANDENDDEIRVITKKKKKNVISDDEDDYVNVEGNNQEQNDGSDSDSTSLSIQNNKIGSKFSKPKLLLRKNNSDKEDNNEQGSHLGGSSIRGVLKALDDKKSPSKLSQSSNSSTDKYRKLNLRTQLNRANLHKPTAKSLKERVRELALSQASQKSTENRQKSVEKSPVKTASKENDSKEKSRTSDNEDEEMSFSDTDMPLTKIARKGSPKKTMSTKLRLAQKTSTSKAKSPTKAQTPPRSEKDNLDILELSPIRDIHSPERNVNTRRKKATNNNSNEDKFVDFVNQAGIVLCSGDSLHIATEDPRDVIQKIKDSLNSSNYEVNEIVNSWENYINDEENLKKSLIEMKIETDEGTLISSKAISLARLLLQVPQLQIDILTSLFKKLVDTVLTADSSDDAPWANQMLQQFRFLEMLVDSNFLIKQIEELLSSSPEWFQREVILFIPDIVTDSQHQMTAEMLMKIMENNAELTNIILDCIHNLNLGKEYREELRQQVLRLLEKDFDKSSVPNITRFVLTACASEEVASKSLKILRLINMAPVSNEKLDECHTHQMFMVNAINSSIQLFKEVAQAAVSIIKSPATEPKPLDLIISILLYESTAARKKIIETALHSYIKDNYFKTSFLTSVYSNYKEVLRNFQSTTLNLAINLLKDSSPTLVEFGIEWLRNIFVSQSDTPYWQREIMEKLLNLMGCKDKTVKSVLEVLCRMADDEYERRFLEHHAGFLRSFLEKIDNLQFDEVATLYHLLHGLCTQSQKIENILSDDLGIIMQKQICSSKVVTKCKGVVGAVMAIKHLAGSREKSDDAFQLLTRTLTSLRTCVKSQALFYDQLGQVIASTENIDGIFIENATNYFSDYFESDCLVDENNDDNLVPRFCLNDLSEQDGTYYVHFGNGKAGTFLPVFFKLLRICYMRQSGNLKDINAVLGFPILMPRDMDMPEPLTADYMINCINWFRELIGGFVSQEENLLREMVLKRLESLMILQGEFVSMVAMCDSNYQPPPCYFHYFPVPQFVRIDIKLNRKGGKRGRKVKKDKEKEIEDCTALSQQLSKSVQLPEWENWEKGSEMTIKNPVFFRRMDTKIINLLDAKMDINSTQATFKKITVAQVCFIVKELLGMFENQVSESFIRDVIQLLPKICAKLKKIIEDLRQNNGAHEKEAVRLLLCLLITLFNWKEFENSRYNTLLRDGLRTLASMMNESSALLRLCKDLVSEAYKYFESLADIATEISLAVSLVNMCGCLMKHSKTFRENFKDKQANMAHGFLCIEWTDEIHGARYRAAVKELLKTWIENEPNPLKTVYLVMEWLPKEAAELKRPQSRLSRLPAITKSNFHLLIKQLFSGLIKGVDISLEMAETDPERIQIWSNSAVCLDQMSIICKTNKNNIYLMLYLRYTALLYQMLLLSGMKVLEANVKYQTDKVLTVIKLFQKSGRFLRDIFCTARKDKIVSLLKLIPSVKSRREKFIYRVKGMLAANNSIEAFWMGNLLNKDLDGEEIASESSEDLTVGSDLNDNTADDVSEIYNSDSDEMLDETEE